MQNDESVQFLTIDDVMRLHDLSIARYGGSYGIRDAGLLSSAVQMPSQTFGGEHLHPTIAAKAAVYLFHVCQNHAFLDGNKRAGLLACEAFLRLNGHELSLTSREAESMTVKVAEGILNKQDLTALLEGSVRRLNSP